MEGDNSKPPQTRNSPPQTMGEPSSCGESVVGDPRSVNNNKSEAPASASSDTCDGQAASRVAMSAPEESHSSPVENGSVNRTKSNGSGVVSSVSATSMSSGTTTLSVRGEALQLFGLKGITRSKVAEVLGSRPSARTEELGNAYMALFDFEGVSVVDALRVLLERCSIAGETQAQARIVEFFARRYAECNSSVGDADAVHSLTAAVMLLNQDLHGQNLGKKMTSSQFLSNVGLLRDGKPPIPKSSVKEVYAQIKSRPLAFVHDDDEQSIASHLHTSSEAVGTIVLPNSVVEVNLDDFPTVIREGLLKRKNVGGGFGHRSWSLRYCVVRGFILHLFKMDGKSARSVPNFADMQSAVLLTHALATPAVKYHKRQYCLQLLDSNGTYHLFQASNYDDLTSWVIAINRAAALHSTKPLAAPIGSCVDRFERPPLPKHPSKAAPEEQLSFYREKVDELIKDIAIEQEDRPSPANKKKQRLFKVWEARCEYMSSELVRYQSYVEAMTLDHDFAPTAKYAGELLSPSHSVSSISSSHSVASVRSMNRSRFQRTSPQSSSLASTAERSQSASNVEAITPPPGSASCSALGKTGSRDSYREAVNHAP
eukprot:scpid63787/ scgid1301/ PH and SEC7 domain-containing protein 4; Pleckstrin homology and SEC7 domain-containing protein 4